MKYSFLHPFHKIVALAAALFICATTRAQAIEASWSTQANEYNLRSGQRYTLHFPAGGMVSGRVWGTGIYTTDCSIASAAVHAGLISETYGGTVTIEILPGQSSYEGSVRNGITSFGWGTFGSSFVFVNTRPSTANISCVVYGNWATQATDYNEQMGRQFTFYFPPGGPLTGQVWGTGIYTTDCSIASAAVHAGIITTQQGGLVTIEILPGQSIYKGTERNGIRSYNWGSFASSFRFVGVNHRGGNKSKQNPTLKKISFPTAGSTR